MLQAFRQMIMSRLAPDWPAIDKDTAILWEPCSKSHGEVVPGYAQLLLDLGYRVVVLMTPDRIAEGLFSRLTHPRLVLTQITQRQIAKFVKTPDVRKAAVLLISTAGKLPQKADATVDLEAVFGPDIPQNLLMVEHDAKARIDAGTWNQDAITLRGLNYRDQGSTVVNPHAFGTVEITPKSKEKTVFLLVGAARAKRRNQNLIYDAAERLVDAGETNFEIRLIGKKGASQIPEKLQSHVTELGRLDFTHMYEEIEKSDFIVTAFQEDNPDHDAYKTVKTTGSYQLCYGFAKPCIVQQDFATGTALTRDNSIFYQSDESVFDALQQAVSMTPDAYQGMQTAMAASAKALYRSSMENLNRLINA